MSQLSTVPVVKCRRCGIRMQVTHLSTAHPDESGEVLYKMLEMVGKRALCPRCQAAHDYYGSQNRSQDWEAGRY